MILAISLSGCKKVVVPTAGGGVPIHAHDGSLDIDLLGETAVKGDYIVPLGAHPNEICLDSLKTVQGQPPANTCWVMKTPWKVRLRSFETDASTPSKDHGLHVCSYQGCPKATVQNVMFVEKMLATDDLVLLKKGSLGGPNMYQFRDTRSECNGHHCDGVGQVDVIENGSEQDFKCDAQETCHVYFGIDSIPGATKPQSP
jgi:hypothetical protein